MQPEISEEMKAKVLAVHRDLSEVLNKHGIDNEVGVPDFILAEYVLAHLGTLKVLDMRLRDHYGA